MLIAQRPTLTEEVISEFRSRFVIEPLEPGFGYTLGNSLRRTLLSSIPGAAVTSIRIDGVLHEFTTVPGVKEDVTEIILNIKELVVSSEHDEPVVMYLRKQGPGTVTARGHRPAGRCRGAQPRAAHRHAERQGQAGDRAHRRARTRLRLGAAEQAVRRRDRPDPGRLDLLAGAQGHLQGRGDPCRAAHRLRQADRRRRDQAGDRAAGRAGLGRQDPRRAVRPGPRAQRRGRGHRDRPVADGRRARRRPGAADRGARADDPVVQLPQARGHPHGGRAGRPQRGGPPGHPQLRCEVDQRGEGEARRAWA